MQIQKENRSEKITIQACHTYMINEDDDTSTDQVKVSLISGEAQIFGMEMKKYYPLKFKMPCIVLIFTWEGCQIKVEWPQQKGGKSKQNWSDLTAYNDLPQSPMIKYLTLHYQLTLARRLAHQDIKKGPRLAIIGGQKSGTHEVSKLMLNYAGKLNMRPIFVDLDLENTIYLDGSMGVAAYQYRVTTQDNLFQKCEKMCYIYGNRKIRKMPYLKIAQQLAKFTNKKMEHEMQNIKWKGTNLQTSIFASGVIMNLPKVSEGQLYLIEIIAEILFNFDITHVLIIENPVVSNFMARNCPNIKIFNASRLQGIGNIVKMKNKNKLKRFFGSEMGQTLKVKINQIFLYELIEQEHKNAYVRRIDIKIQHINKTAVSIIKCKRQNLDPEEIAKKISQNTVYSACRISKIQEEYVTFETPFVDNFYEQSKDLIWVSMIAQK